MQPTKALERFASSLGRADYSEEGIWLYNAECTQALDRMPLECVDLTVTSPPYNIGKEYEAELDINVYIDWSTNWLRSIYNLTKPGGAFWLNVGYTRLAFRGRAVPLAYLLWDKSPFFLQQEVVWNYGAGVASTRAFSPRNEKLLWFVKDPLSYTFNLDEVRDKDVKYPNQKKNGKLRCNPLGKNPTDVWQIPKVTSGKGRSSSERTSHPAQFPESLIERVILASSNEGDTILDPFAGSGTTAVVARRLKRKFIGFEIRPDYFRIAAKRVSDESSQPALFGAG